MHKPKARHRAARACQQVDLTTMMVQCNARCQIDDEDTHTHTAALHVCGPSNCTMNFQFACKSASACHFIEVSTQQASRQAGREVSTRHIMMAMQIDSTC
mmetsp:Transcript_11353/g.18690  ORF Transcript_11353/g.18690 Transcript_11353/m.18690 type:complete len:100 (+) Transcript_11353:1-300(+)